MIIMPAHSAQCRRPVELSTVGGTAPSTRLPRRPGREQTCETGQVVSEILHCSLIHRSSSQSQPLARSPFFFFFFFSLSSSPPSALTQDGRSQQRVAPCASPQHGHPIDLGPALRQLSTEDICHT